MSKIYFCSDWHFCHDKDFIWGPRGFKNQWEMNEAIIKNHNAIVEPDDDVYCLGDFIMTNNDEGIKCLKQLKGKIHIIRGNHDSDARLKLYESCHNVVEICDAKFLKIGKQMFFLSHYPCLTSNSDEGKPLSRRVINLAGHIHTNDKFLDMDKGLIYHVECDAHNCCPVSVEEVLENIKIKLEEK